MSTRLRSARVGQSAGTPARDLAAIVQPALTETAGCDMRTTGLVTIPRANERAGIMVVPGRVSRRIGTVVLAAIDDDTGPGPVLASAQEQADRRGVPLRVVHVWAEQRRGGSGRRGVHQREITAADHLLSGCIADNLPPPEAGAVERQILHDRDPARALIALSREAVLLVVAAKPDGRLGTTVQRLAGRTWCPLAIVPTAPVTSGRW